ncbi:hypothetical protein SARC_03793 [Sphaeroforma arctica JP610]|uniref:Uncharacterized protein n=1 Tax=Sphaeroforma arctica JP610 TaxID=667725 RepID=A0A0L0G6W4_9EUKA|nr:hypothetical protein SARC_03793 [Sphaeroforma arctica JP610]KNC83973.1 hypothetical protein SARC_03793 [Sphaeroforma arctica JP610]|eukprot:XP_014157875.1 hypothetical protein SARC_03793 [Sphaeroforma arctica JP610]
MNLRVHILSALDLARTNEAINILDTLISLRGLPEIPENLPSFADLYARREFAFFFAARARGFYASESHNSLIAMHVASVNVLKQYLPDSYNTKFLCPQFVSQMRHGPLANARNGIVETTVSSRTVKMSPNTTTTGIPYLYHSILAVNTAREFDTLVRESMLLFEEYAMLVELWNTNLAGPEMNELVGLAWETIIAAPHDFLACMFRLADADNMRIFLQLGRLTRSTNNPSYLY